LPRQEVDKLLDARTRYGVRTLAGREPGCPISAEELGEDKITVTRAELIALIDEAVRAQKQG
jgi:L-fuculose-phosphate aldolase